MFCSMARQLTARKNLIDSFQAHFSAYARRGEGCIERVTVSMRASSLASRAECITAALGCEPLAGARADGGDHREKRFESHIQVSESALAEEPSIVIEDLVRDHRGQRRGIRSDRELTRRPCHANRPGGSIRR
jgi:hypothetical protein